MEKLLKINNVTAGYDKTNVLNNISFEVKEKEFVGIIGPNGSGKTTLARAITRVISITGGSIHYRGLDMKNIPLKDIAKKIAFVPQEINTVFSMDVFDLVAMGRFPYVGRFRDETKKDIEIVKRSLALTDASGLESRDIDEISSGERQRVLIAKALAQEPELLILDEPTSKLDIGHQTFIMDLVKKLNREKNITVISILHDLNIASDYCDRLIILNKGSIAAVGSPDEILNYKIIEDVYNTTVIVKPSPVTNKPHVILTPRDRTY